MHCAKESDRWMEVQILAERSHGYLIPRIEALGAPAYQRLLGVMKQ
jgi:hypothetical protein